MSSNSEYSLKKTLKTYWNNLTPRNQKLFKLLFLFLVLLSIPLTVTLTQLQQNLNSNAESIDPWSTPFLARPASGAIKLTGAACNNITIENKTFKDLGVDVEAIRLDGCSNVTIRNNDFANVAQAITVYNSTNVKIEYNRYQNILGPHERVGKNRANFAQLANTRDGYISHNKGVGGDTEDIISMFGSGGSSSSSPFIIEFNHFEGTNWTSTAGSGIATGDNGGSNIIARNNTLLNPGQVGMFIAGGTNIKLLNNTVYGEKRTASNVAMYVWSQDPSPCSGHEVSGNKVKWFNQAGSSNPFWNAGNCGTVITNGNDFNASLDPNTMHVDLNALAGTVLPVTSTPTPTPLSLTPTLTKAPTPTPTVTNVITPTPTTTSQACDTNAVGVNSFIGCLYDGGQFEKLVSAAPSGNVLSSPVISTQTGLNFDWGLSTPNSIVGVDSFSIRWKGDFTFPAGTYTFIGGSDDGIRVRFNGVTKLDKWTGRAYTEDTFTHTFSATTKVRIEVDYNELSNPAKVNFRWILQVPATPTLTQVPTLPPSTPTLTPTLKPTATLTPIPPTPTKQPSSDGDGLLGMYYANRNLSGTPIYKIDPNINFDWKKNPPINELGPNNFSLRWSGYILPTTSETYTIYARSDDGIRVWINNQLIINAWNDHSVTEFSGNIFLNASQKYQIKVEYYERNAYATAKLSWSSPSVSKTIVPQSQLYTYR